MNTTENYERSFYLLTQISDDFKLEREFNDWHLPYIYFKKNVVCKKQYIDGLYGRDSIEEIITYVFDVAEIDSNNYSFSQDNSGFNGVTQTLERLLLTYDWMKLIDKIPKSV